MDPHRHGQDSNPITTYLGSEALTGSIRPGRAVAPVATLAPTWKDATYGLVSVPVRDQRPRASRPAPTS